jgi:hypothetical protein
MKFVNLSLSRLLVITAICASPVPTWWLYFHVEKRVIASDTSAPAPPVPLFANYQLTTAIVLIFMILAFIIFAVVNGMRHDKNSGK